jgi:hypothetical protein
VLTSFTKPFVHAASAVRVYVSESALAVIDRRGDAPMRSARNAASARTRPMK